MIFGHYFRHNKGKWYTFRWEVTQNYSERESTLKGKRKGEQIISLQSNLLLTMCLVQRKANRTWEVFLWEIKQKQKKNKKNCKTVMLEWYLIQIFNGYYPQLSIYKWVYFLFPKWFTYWYNFWRYTDFCKTENKISVHWWKILMKRITSLNDWKTLFNIYVATFR